MTRAQLVDALAERRRIPRRLAEEAVRVFFESLTDALAEGRRVELRGFGSFSVREYRGYVGRNPRSGREVVVPPRRLPVFKVGKVLKAELVRSVEG